MEGFSTSDGPKWWIAELNCVLFGDFLTSVVFDFPCTEEVVTVLHTSPVKIAYLLS